jgi:hypothetical protein
MSADIKHKNFDTEESPVNDKAVGDVVNASGHKQELQRNFGLLSICAIAVTTGNTWIAQGGSVVSIWLPIDLHDLIGIRNLLFMPW